MKPVEDWWERHDLPGSIHESRRNSGANLMLFKFQSNSGHGFMVPACCWRETSLISFGLSSLKSLLKYEAFFICSIKNVILSRELIQDFARISDVFSRKCPLLANFPLSLPTFAVDYFCTNWE